VRAGGIGAGRADAYLPYRLINDTGVAITVDAPAHPRLRPLELGPGESRDFALLSADETERKVGGGPPSPSSLMPRT
jgi:hypothetical protein